MTRSKSFTALALTILLVVPLLSFSSRPANAERPEAETGAKKASHTGRAKFVRPKRNQDAANMPHILAASYYSLNGNLDATLTLNNKGPHPLEVQPTLFSQTGARFDLSAVTVDGNSFRVINLRDYAGVDTPFQEGSLQVLYHGMDLQLGGQVKLVDAERSLIFDEQLVEPAKMFASARLEGVWWLPTRRCAVRLVLSNTTDLLLSATARVEGSAPRQKEPLALALLPHETRVMDVARETLGSAGGKLLQVGGISLEHTGSPGALLARAMVQEPSTGYSAPVQFSDPQTAKSSELHGAGLRIGRVAAETLTPVVVARNNGSAATVLRGRLSYTASDGRAGVVTLPDLHLASGEVNTVKLSGAINQSGLLRERVASAGLEFRYTSAPGSVVIAAQSTSANDNQVFRVPMIDARAMPSSTGGYPWSIAGGSSTFVYIKNVTERRQQYVLQLNYAGGVYAPGLKTVEAGQTAVIDVRALRDRQVADEHGSVIPREAISGQVTWSMDGADDLVLIGRAEQADITHAMSSSYACANCCPAGFYDGWCDPGSVVGVPGDTTQFRAWQQNEDCYGTLLEPFLRAAGWSSLDTTIATVTTGGLATARNPGSTQIRANYGTQYVWELLGPSESCYRTSIHPIADALCDVFEAKVGFKTAKLYEVTASFGGLSLSAQSATLKAGSSSHGNEICGSDPQLFTVTVNFALPPNSTLVKSRCTARPIGIPDNDYNVGAPATVMDDTILGTGHMNIPVRRRCCGGGDTHPSISVTIGGDRTNGPGVVDTTATVKILCSQ